MPTIKERSVLSGMRVNETMRRQVAQLPMHQTLAKGINYMIRYKIGAVLITDDSGKPEGVVSKTDIIGAYYAGLPVETSLGDLMTGPPLFCYPDDALESALDMMQQNGIHRLYVRGSDENTIIGILAYPDIVGQIYRFCRVCRKGIRNKADKGTDADGNRAAVKEAMRRSIDTFHQDDLLAAVMEALSVKGPGAVLITDANGRPVGVVSRTDLIIAYNHGIPIETPAGEVMSTPVDACSEESLLVDALRQMLVRDIQRLFVYGSRSDLITGVLSLSDAARFRSGTCKACMPSRVMTG